MTIEKLEEIILLQKKLNDNTNSPSWVFGLSKLKNSVNWLRCVHMEVSELIESRPWKHWKNLNEPADTQNEQIELTDILHFLVSYGIHVYFIKKLYLLEADLIKLATRKQSIKDPEIDMPEFNKINKVFDAKLFDELIMNHKYKNLLLRLNNEDLVIEEKVYNEFFEEIKKELVEFIYKEINKGYSFKENISLISKYEHMSLFALSGSILEETEENLCLELFLQKEMYFSKVANVFGAIVKKDVVFNLSGFYFGKNVLNQFRQDNGYKEKTYIKIWNNEEDNVHMLKIVHKLNESASFDKIYEELESIYKTLK